MCYTGLFPGNTYLQTSFIQSIDILSQQDKQ